MDNTKKIRHLSLCSGYDGIGIGLERAGVDIGFTVHVEIEAFASYNLVKKIESKCLGEGVLWSDLKTFPFRKFRGCFDILSGGFPCQPFSQAGKGKGDEDPRHLFPYIRKGIEDCQPSVVFLENVEGIVSAKLKGDHWNDPAGTPVLLHVLRELERLGYRATAIPTSASEVGAPHQRNRWFILGIRNEVENPECLRGWCEGGNTLHEGREARSSGASSVQEATGRENGSSEPDNQSAGGDGDKKLADSLRRRGEVSDSGEDPGEQMLVSDGGTRRTLWPSRPGKEQHEWEPPRVVGDSVSDGHTPSEKSRGVGEEQEEGRVQKPSGGCEQAPDNSQVKSPVGGTSDGASGGVGYAELYESCDNRIDELRLLGNGCVPASVSWAFREGIRVLCENN